LRRVGNAIPSLSVKAPAFVPGSASPSQEVQSPPDLTPVSVSSPIGSDDGKKNNKSKGKDKDISKFSA